jgi:hydroxylysine kinase
MMLESIRSGIVDPFEAAGHVVAGYSSQRRADQPLPLSELKLLRVLVACRLCQSLVYGAYTHSQDPGNVYVLTTAGRGWTLMNQIWNENTDEQFFEICSKYL